MNNNHHAGPVIPVPEDGRKCAYEDEPIQTVLCLRGRPARGNHQGIGRTEDFEEFMEYELTIQRHTGNSLVVTLRKETAAKRLCRERNERGYGTKAEVYTKVMSFAQIVNALLGPGCDRFEDVEAIPDKVKEAMKGVYSSGQ